MKTVHLLHLILLCIAFISASAHAKDDPGQQVRLQPPAKENPALPYVLLVGDSIAQSYVPRAQELLANEANVYFTLTPHGVFDGNVFLDTCFKKREWDLVHLNYGLDSMRHEDAVGHLADAPAGKQIVSPLEYSRTLSGMVNYFLQRKTKRIWATTTPIPEGVTGYVAGESKQRNIQYQTLIGARLFFFNNLYDYVDLRRADMMEPNSVEMTEAGARLLGEVVAGRILEVLNEGGDKSLPYILLLGDSISNGYNVTVRERLLGKANVLWGGSVFGKNPDMAKLVKDTVINREKQIGRKIKVVHVNWGLHAMKFVDDNNHLKTPETGQRCVPLEDYGNDLETFVTSFQKTGSKLIWASTTPVNGSAWARDGDSVAYNAVAASVMKRHGVMINDLYTYVKENKLHKKHGDCHFNAEASARLAIPITESILRVLQEH
ncbi:MAG: SGNH/GDSL hydrolase family protein [Planctomycetes bacterium]|nr:SGNH/GDSL hydrolase family protein [Planctomycetota bacterium]MCH9724630.1 SGNH/GDSL hydrolase family protein [Planctomycetota bacterium]MCH9777919.1 SGNH/GDSL hydrolase family protein [Planctomycetota bacterium]